MSLLQLTCDRDQMLAHTNDPCSRETGRVRGVILFDGSFDIQTIISLLQSGTAADAANVVHRISAGIDAGKVHIINQTTGTYNGGEPHTADGFLGDETRLLWYNHQVKFEDPTYDGNRDFWQKAQRDMRYVAWRTETMLHFSDKPANIVVTAPVDSAVTSAVTWHVDLTWKSKNLPEISHVGIFDKILTYGGVPNIFTSEYTTNFV